MYTMKVLARELLCRKQVSGSQTWSRYSLVI